MINKKRSLQIVLMNLFIAFLGIGLVIPVLPTIMNELNLSGKTVGYLVAAFAFVQLIVSPIAGKWVDQFGRKKMIIIGLIIFSFSEFLFGIGKTIEILFLSRMLGGVSAAFIMPAVTAYIADVTTLEERPKALGYMSAAINTGFIIGPGIGGFLAEVHTRLPFYSAAVIALIAALMSILLLREPERYEEVMAPDLDTVKQSNLKKVLSPVYFIAFTIVFISTFGLATFESLFSLFIDHKFGFSPKDIAIIITGGAVFGAIFQVVFFERFAKWWGEIRLIQYSMLLSIVLVFAVTLVHSYFFILITTITVFIGFDLMRPALTTYLSRNAGNEQGFVAGMNSMFTSIGNVVGPVVGGFLFDIDLNYPYYSSMILLAIGLIFTLFWNKNRKSNVKKVDPN